jgi:hypothetical protein
MRVGVPDGGGGVRVCAAAWGAVGLFMDGSADEGAAAGDEGVESGLHG